MDGSQILVLMVLGLAIVALVREWFPTGVIALAAPLILVITQTLEVEVFLQGFSHPAVVALAGMFVVSEGVSRTGALGFLGDSLARVARRGRRRILGTMMLGVALISAFVNNTTVVLVCLPVVLAMCERMDHPPSRYLIPLSFASIFGGTLTLVGTSTNLVVAEVGRRSVRENFGDEGFAIGMWDFLPVGMLFLVVGVAYVVFWGSKLLPDRVALSMTLSRGMPTEYVTEAEVLAGSPTVGKTLGDLADRYRIRVLQLIRHDAIELPDRKAVLQVGDVILVKGGASDIIDLSDTAKTALLPAGGETGMKTRQVDMTLAEVIVPPSSRWIDRKVQDIGFRSRYGVAVIAVQRHGHHVREKVGEMRVEPADTLLVQGSVDSLRNLRSSENLILIEGVQEDVKMRTLAPVALGILAVFVSTISFGALDIATAALLSGLLMVLARCITVQQAYASMDWNILLLLAGFLGLGRAMEVVGLAEDAAELLLAGFEGLPAWVQVGLLFLFTSVVSDVLSNQATAALMVPVVVKASALLGAPPMMFLMTVAFAASAAFLTPVGYQTNLLVYGPGGYRFSDFIKIGLPLKGVLVIVASFSIPWIYGS